MSSPAWTAMEAWHQIQAAEHYYSMKNSLQLRPSINRSLVTYQSDQIPLIRFFMFDSCFVVDV